MSYLDDYTGKTITGNGVPMPDRKGLKITAPGATFTDDPSGTGSTNLDLSNVGLPTYDAVTDLRAVAPVNELLSYTLGHTTVGDGGGGIWRGVTGAAAATYTHNGGTVIVPIGGDGTAAWVREYSGGVRPEWFGAVRDGSTDDSAPVQAALDLAVSDDGSLLLSDGTYTLASTLTATDSFNIKGEGWGCVLKSSGSDVDVLYINGADRVIIKDISIEGNNTGTGGSSGAGGNGITLDDTSEGILISGCRFNDIGVVSGASSAKSISCFGANQVVVTDCFFAENSFSETGGDINMTRCKDSVVSDNISYSEHDAFVGFSSLPAEPDASDVLRHTVTGNVIRREAENARSAIIVPYAASTTNTTVTGNVIEGFIWNGIYISAPVAPLTTASSGKVTVTGNMVRYCGGGAGSVVGAGVYISGSGGGTCTGNYVEHQGKDSTQTPRGSPSHGIQAVQYTKGFAVTGNFVRECTDIGIQVAAGGTEDLTDITVTGNTVLNSGSYGINLVSQASTSFVRRAVVSSNVVTHDADTIGVRVALSASGEYYDLLVANNQLTYTGGSSSTDWGISWSHANTTHTGGVVRGNHVRGYDRGFNLGTSVDRGMPEHLLVEGNVFEDCAVGIQSPSGTNNISLGNMFHNCTLNVEGVNWGFRGRHLGYNASREMTVELTRSATPANGAWYAGDMVIDESPSAGGKIGWVCVTGGSPGTWKAYGVIDP